MQKVWVIEFDNNTIEVVITASSESDVQMMASEMARGNDVMVVSVRLATTSAKILADDIAEGQ